ncbi:hypothetical protein SETIT_8G118700v2 [Setaria italica]|uniref:DNA helicase Pif1-like 2B domain-containing protein n=1 Tax=Setaria italica TaxID=4555 RepID=A0A368S6Y4_SETIT|nr:hypothetical protein SETIT_8G118700v2 [Setaria italica]
MNMRLVIDCLDSVAKEEISKFSDWVLLVGDGTLPIVSRALGDYGAWIQIPDDMLIVTTAGDRIRGMIDVVYDNFSFNFKDETYLCKRAIVSPSNDVADEMNSAMILIVPGERKEYLSFDCVSKCSDTVGNVDLLYTVEFLNSLKVNHFLDHCLVLKVGVQVMLLRNLNQMAGLCNGTRLIITNLANRILEARISTGSNIGDIVYVPRIVLSARNKKWPFTLQRRQFPIRVCYAMTITKSQGQTLLAVGLYLRNPGFSHDKLYVGVSRVTSKRGLKIFVEDGDNGCGKYTKNIVYPEVFASPRRSLSS